MKPETYRILNDPELLAIRDRYQEQLQQVSDGTYDAHRAFVLSGIDHGYSGDETLSLEDQLHAALDELAGMVDVLRDKRIFRPLTIGIPREKTVGFSEYFFGAVGTDMEKDHDQQFLAKPVGALDPPPVEDCPAFIESKAAVKRFLEADVKLPGICMPLCGAPLVEAVSLYGEAFLVAMLDDPEAAQHDLDIITDVQTQIIKWYVENVPAEQLRSGAPRLRTQPPGRGQIAGCSTQLVGPEQYRDMVAPLDDKILSASPDGGMIHICGYHTQHLETWRNMESLKVLQLSGDAVTDVAQYLEGTRDDQIVYVSPSAVISLPELMQITKGKRAVFALYPKDIYRVPREIDDYENCAKADPYVPLFG
jgi:hypothetical protein